MDQAQQTLLDIMMWLRLQRRGHATRVYGGPYRRYVPDIVGSIKGQTVVLKLAPSGLITASQEHELARWERAGAVIGIVRSLDDVRHLLLTEGLEVEDV